MKTERRHELAQNDLAAWLERNYELVKPYSKVIAGVVIGVVVLGAGYAFKTKQGREKARDCLDRTLLGPG